MLPSVPTSAMMPSHSTRHPLVILAGWLGSQPKNLRRYKVLWESLNCEVKIYNCSPSQVVKASIEDSSLGDLTKQVCSQVQRHPCWFFHAFSNGGCFLWEQVRLLTEHRRGPKPLGVVFDSSPSFYEGDKNQLFKALLYCSWREQIQEHLRIMWGGSKLRQQARIRAQQYWDRLRCDDWYNVRQLYLCSRDDELTPFAALEELMDHRRQICGSHIIWSHIWDSSPHCSHLLHHSQEYQQVLRAFVEECLYNENNSSTWVRSRL
jgi:hypothetical protein